ncbi:THAP domain-containing protein 1-like [Metopolophium dirhodum]|uniref:THAP domain-containing protein 1-like n=1 Tax=Metopolophium dirhodum TaxID=44670 RepID=UPI00298FD1F3|nr:THAP domain-containing protein 1-like [Metopolophium dirhodum]
MSTNSKKKHSGGSSCAVATCKHYASKTKEQGFDISFHRFPIKNVEIYNMWVHKCRRGDKWNPKTSLVCSKHFTQDSFVRDLNAELLGYTPKVRLLKPDAVPTLYLPPDHSQSVTSSSAINRNKRIEAKSMKQVHDELILSSITSTSPDSLSPSIEISSTINADSIPFPDKSPLNMNYEQLYNDLLKKHNELKVENDKQKDKILSLEKPLVDYKKLIPKGSDRIFKRTEIEQKYKPVIQSYVKQRLLIRMKYFNQHAVSLAKKRKAKAQLSRINKLRKLMT